MILTKDNLPEWKAELNQKFLDKYHSPDLTNIESNHYWRTEYMGLDTDDAMKDQEESMEEPKRIVSGLKNALLVCKAINIMNADALEELLDTVVLQHIIEYGNERVLSAPRPKVIMGELPTREDIISAVNDCEHDDLTVKKEDAIFMLTELVKEARLLTGNGHPESFKHTSKWRELPTDEEIKNRDYKLSQEGEVYYFQDGAKWMRDIAQERLSWCYDVFKMKDRVINRKTYKIGSQSRELIFKSEKNKAYKEEIRKLKAQLGIQFDDTGADESDWTVRCKIYIKNPYVRVFGGSAFSEVVNNTGIDYEKYLPEGGYEVHLSGKEEPLMKHKTELWAEGVPPGKYSFRISNASSKLPKRVRWLIELVFLFVIWTCTMVSGTIGAALVHPDPSSIYGYQIMSVIWAPMLGIAVLTWLGLFYSGRYIDKYVDRL